MRTCNSIVVEAYRLDRYDNLCFVTVTCNTTGVVEAYRLDRYDNLSSMAVPFFITVVEAYRLDRYDNKRFSWQASIG